MNIERPDPNEWAHPMAKDRIEELERALKVLLVWSEVAMERSDAVSVLRPEQVAAVCRRTLKIGVDGKSTVRRDK